eukprot:c5624_g1_i1 orf=272-565(+)
MLKYSLCLNGHWSTQASFSSRIEVETEKTKTIYNSCCDLVKTLVSMGKAYIAVSVPTSRGTRRGGLKPCSFPAPRSCKRDTVSHLASSSSIQVTWLT